LYFQLFAIPYVVNKDVHKKVGTAKNTRIHGLSDDRENCMLLGSVV